MKQILGYCVPWSVRPGDRTDLKVSAPENVGYHLSVVRIINPLKVEGTPPLDLRPMDCALNGPHFGRPQTNATGSYIRINLSNLQTSKPIERFSIWMFPTLQSSQVQAIASLNSDTSTFGLSAFELDFGTDRLVSADVNIGSSVVQVKSVLPLKLRQWYHIELAREGDRVSLSITPRDGLKQTSHADFRTHGNPKSDTQKAPELWLAAKPSSKDAYPIQSFNGKLEAPMLLAAGSEVLSAWDFSQFMQSDRVVDSGPQALHGKTFQCPARAVTGSKWNGDVHDPRFCPEHYAAIHFHEDDLYDAGWQTNHQLTIPEDWDSGAYAFLLKLGDETSLVPFFVCPPKGKATASAVFVVSSATTLAYANYQFHMRHPHEESLLGRLPVLRSEDLFLKTSPHLGLSCYDLHADGSGIRYSSRLRPVINLCTEHDVWNFGADTLLLTWLQKIGQKVDIITDEELHHDGIGVLSPWQCVIFGSHPEYHSTAMLDAIEDYLGHGGRLMYLGGNGFYWRAGFCEDFPGAIEVRRAEGGGRIWAESPGESYLSFTGEYGSLWRRCGRPPQQLVGIGMRAIGFDGVGHYEFQSDALSERARFITTGIDTTLAFGKTGLIGSAAGEELDAVDAALGTPSHTLVIAASRGHTNAMQLVPEDVLMPYQGQNGASNPDVRSDVVFFETPSGGAVFSVGSMTWTACLQGPDSQTVADITRNVLTRFVDPTPFEWLVGS